MQGIVIEDPQGELALISYYNFSSLLSASSDPTFLDFIPRCLEINSLLGKWHSSLRGCLAQKGAGGNLTNVRFPWGKAFPQKRVPVVPQWVPQGFSLPKLFGC